MLFSRRFALAGVMGAPLITYANVEPSPDGAKRFEEKIQQFIELCADGSYLTATIFRKEDQYGIDVSVEHVQGRFGVRAWNRDLDQLLNRAIHQLFHQLGDWRELRFIDVLPGAEDCPEVKAPSVFDAKGQVLIVDDDPFCGKILKNLFLSLGMMPRVLSEPEAAIHEITSGAYDLLVLDWCLPYMDGGTLLRKAEEALSSMESKHKPLQIPVVVCSGKSRDQVHLPEKSKNFPVIDYWEKGISFLTALERAEKMVSLIKPLAV